MVFLVCGSFTLYSKDMVVKMVTIQLFNKARDNIVQTMGLLTKILKVFLSHKTLIDMCAVLPGLGPQRLRPVPGRERPVPEEWIL